MLKFYYIEEIPRKEQGKSHFVKFSDEEKQTSKTNNKIILH